ncbi:hypothetical protein [Halobacillus salinarum]|nr:hypothetical protein [Halobacillus salinarum]
MKEPVKVKPELEFCTLLNPDFGEYLPDIKEESVLPEKPVEQH